MPAEAACYIGIGSNLGDSAAYFRFARQSLEHSANVSALRISPLYRSKAVGPANQPDYLNAVFELRTTLVPLDLLALLQRIESAAGRVRNERWGPRTLDLDLLLYGEQQIQEPALQVPHPHLAERNFVVCPLFDLVPAMTLPDGTRLADLQRALGLAGLERVMAQEITDDWP